MDITDQGFLRSQPVIQKKNTMKKSELREFVKETINQIMDEEKWLQKAVHPSKKGMFDGKSLQELEKMKTALEKRNQSHISKGEKVPHKNTVVMGQLNFAIRAKRHKLT